MSVDPLEGALSFLRVRELSWDQLVVPRPTLEALQLLTSRAAAGGLVAVVAGPAGVGKTVAVRTCAEELRLDTWRVDARAVVERYGVTTRDQLPRILARGDRPHAVVLFHGADWLCTSAAADALPRLRALGAARLAPTVLELRDPGVCDLSGLPRVDVPFPDVAARAELWRRLGWRAHPLIDVDVGRLAALPLPGAAIEQLLDQALADVGGVPTTDDLLALAGRPLRPPSP